MKHGARSEAKQSQKAKAAKKAKAKAKAKAKMQERNLMPKAKLCLGLEE
jgi:hypothetical protein